MYYEGSCTSLQKNKIVSVTARWTLQKDSRDKRYKNVNSRVKFPAVLLS
jgi:hypothetical protein